MTHHLVFLTSYVSLPIHYLSPTEGQWRPGGQLGNSYKSVLASPSTLATYFLYIVYSISIDLELSRLCNSSHYKAYRKEPATKLVVFLILPYKLYLLYIFYILPLLGPLESRLLLTKVVT